LIIGSQKDDLSFVNGTCFSEKENVVELATATHAPIAGNKAINR
jgi:hypothetical protein